MRRFVAIAALAAAWALFGHASAQAAEPIPTEACLKPLPSGAADPQPRDVHFHITNGSSLVSITMCVVSNKALPLQGASANIGVFQKDGVLINYAGAGYTNVLPLANPTADGPKLVLMFGVTIDVDAKYGQQFANDTVVALATVACSKPLPDCAPGPTVTQTFLLPVQIDQDLPGGKPAKTQ
jgi:hypothetical protein